jgi:predicted RND superfamily exporter protein
MSSERTFQPFMDIQRVIYKQTKLSLEELDEKVEKTPYKELKDMNLGEDYQKIAKKFKGHAEIIQITIEQFEGADLSYTTALQELLSDLQKMSNHVESSISVYNEKLAAGS